MRHDPTSTFLGWLVESIGGTWNEGVGKIQAQPPLEEAGEVSTL